MDLVNLDLASGAGIAVLGYCVVFLGIVMLMLVVLLLCRIMIAKQKKEEAKAVAAAPVEAPPIAVVPAPASLAPGSAGDLKLYDTDPRDAAMIMAIVADSLGKPINELRFISIKEVKEE